MTEELLSHSLTEERIEYFEKVIDSAQNKLARHYGLLSEEQKAQLMTMISTAQAQISIRKTIHCQ
jgi:molecular chaperone DnaK (HSP70)